MIRTTTMLAEIRLGSIVSYLGTTDLIVVPFSRLFRLPWGQRSSVCTRSQTSLGRASTRLAVVSRLKGRLAHVSVLRSWMRSTSSISLWQWNCLCTSRTRDVVPHQDKAIFLVQQKLGDELEKFGKLGLTLLLLE